MNLRENICDFHYRAQRVLIRQIKATHILLISSIHIPARKNGCTTYLNLGIFFKGHTRVMRIECLKLGSGSGNGFFENWEKALVSISARNYHVTVC